MSLSRAKSLLEQAERDLSRLPSPKAVEVAALVAIGYALVELAEQLDEGPELWGFDEMAAQAINEELAPIPPDVIELDNDEL